MIILVEIVVSIDIVPHQMDMHMIGITVINLSILRKIKIGMIFCHVINHPIPSTLKYFLIFTSQKCIGAIPIFRIIEIRIKLLPESVKSSFLVNFIVVIYISKRTEAIV